MSGLKRGLKNHIFWSEIGSGFWKPCSTIWTHCLFYGDTAARFSRGTARSIRVSLAAEQLAGKSVDRRRGTRKYSFHCLYISALFGISTANTTDKDIYTQTAGVLRSTARAAHICCILITAVCWIKIRYCITLWKLIAVVTLSRFTVVRGLLPE